MTCFVPLSHFDDNLLLSDYNLLEQTKRVAESAGRLRSKLCTTSSTSSSYHPHFKLPFALKTLRTAAASRRTKLLFLPSGMSRRETNQTRFNHRKKYISWSIEWWFHSTDVVLLDHGVHEDTSLFSVIEKRLQPSPWNHPLRQFFQEQLDCLKFFIRKYPKVMCNLMKLLPQILEVTLSGLYVMHTSWIDVNWTLGILLNAQQLAGVQVAFRELDIKAPIRQQLADIVVLEYPIIHVFLPSERCDFEVIKENHPIAHRMEGKDSSSADNEIPKGATFKEEEIEDNGSSLDPQVFDLMKHVMSSPMHQIPQQNKSEKAFGNSVWSLSTRAGAGKRVHSGSQNQDSGVCEDMEFDFDQGLIDAYSDLIAENNPDDFLDLEGEFAKQSETEDRRDLSNSRRFFFAEEVEEGEIVD